MGLKFYVFVSCVSFVVLSDCLDERGFKEEEGKLTPDLGTESLNKTTEVTEEVNAEETGVRNQEEIANTNLICDMCECNDTDIDCSDKELRSFFTADDWNALNLDGKINVDLSNNPLSSISEIPEVDIQSLNISRCQIHFIADASFMKLKNLTSLDLARNRITSSDISRRVFMGYLQPGQHPQIFKNLVYLDLSYNEIHSLPQELFLFMVEITYLGLSGNPLGYIDQVTMAALTDLLNLQELRLSNCNLETLPEGLFRRHRRLAKLDLSGNRFTIVPEVLREANNLGYFSFDNNPIEYINETTAISSLKNLQELSLSLLSRLKSISDGALGGLSSLVTLHLSQNPRLSDLGPEFLVWTDELDMQKWPPVKEIYLNDNSLREINPHFLERWDQLAKADFSGNPYVCDCRNQWTVDVLVPVMSKFGNNSSVTNMICKKPKELVGLSFSFLHEMSKVLACERSEVLTQTHKTNTGVVLGVLIGIFVTFPMVFLITLLWKKGYFARCRKNQQDKDFYDEMETDAF